MSISTGRSSIDASGNIYIYQPPGAGLVNRGNSIVNGTYQQVNAGEQITLSAGIWQFANGSGQLQVVEGGSLTYQVVTITPGPILGPATITPPQTTGAIGVSPLPSGYVYTPPNAAAVPLGSQVSYGPPVTLAELETLPNLGYVNVQAGASATQAVNLALVRPITIQPL